MIFIILGAIIGAMTVGRQAVRDFGWSEGMFPAVLMVVVFGLIGLIPAMLVDLAAPKETILTHEIEIVAIADNSSIEGRFFLGSGRIEEEPYYFFYAKDGAGFRQQKVRAANAVVYENNDVVPHIDYYTQRNTGYWRLFALQLDCACQNFVHIYIPKGTIVRDFNLDLQ